MTEPSSPQTRRHGALFMLTLTRLKEYSREPSTFFWSIIFPVLITLALGSAFKRQGQPELHVGVLEGPGAAELVQTLESHPLLTAQAFPEAEARLRLQSGRVALLVIPPTTPDGKITYRFDPSRPEAPAARAFADDALQRAQGRTDVRAVVDDQISTPGARYVDWLIPGLLGMNVMSGCMWGITWVIALARHRRLLKRFVATPMNHGAYLLSLLFARVLFVLCVDLPLMLGFGHLVLGMPILGSLASVVLVTVLGIFAFSGVAFLCGSRVRSTETGVGVINLVVIPMFALSGIFFSSSRFPEAVQPVIRALPLTALNDCLRAVINDGESLSAIAPRLAVLGAWAVICFLLSLRLFRWT
ncbi:ABC transporter permease [Hyalangium versicolor]|uniref:ABC transporter permease n=1 Tax=Hyalangium versicolor TaxID=2861190 RepID=UPI001CCC8CB2|nr:ABC transporter permease [Hyalangium versicolor]